MDLGKTAPGLGKTEVDLVQVRIRPRYAEADLVKTAPDLGKNEAGPGIASLD